MDIESIKYKNYLETRRQYIDSIFNLGTTLGKYLLTFSLGILAFSLTFINDIISSLIPGTMWLIGTSWGFLVSSALLTLMSMKFSQSAHEDFLDILDEQQKKGEVNYKPYLENKNAKRTKCSSNWSIGLFVLGTCLLTIFIGMNLYCIWTQ